MTNDPDRWSVVNDILIFARGQECSSVFDEAYPNSIDRNCVSCESKLRQLQIETASVTYQTAFLSVRDYTQLCSESTISKLRHK